MYKQGQETEFDQIDIRINTVSASGHGGTRTRTIGLQDQRDVAHNPKQSQSFNYFW